MAQTLESIAEMIRHHPRLVIADDFEIAFQHTVCHSTRFQNGLAAQDTQTDRLWVSLRILHRKRGGKASWINPTKENLSQLVDAAFESAQRSSLDPWFRFPIWKALTPPNERDAAAFSEGSHYDLLGAPATLFDEVYDKRTVETFIRRKTEKQNRSSTARRFSSRLSLFQSGENETPFFLREERVGRGLPEEVQGWVRALGLKAAQRAQGKAGRMPQGAQRVLLSPQAAALWLQSVAPWFYADRFQEGRSPLGEAPANVASVITLIDDGRHPSSAQGAWFDLEGSPTQKTVLVKKGAQQSCLYDVYSATRENRLSTGNYFRAPSDGFASIQPSALYLEPGTQGFEAMLREVGEGIYLDQVERWDFTPQSPRRVGVLASGWRVSGGKLAEPLSGIEAEWDLGALLQGAAAVGSELEFFAGFGAPPVLIDGLALRS
ncbi:hypothetical protein K2X33_13585 [bacterium]|nr:hypothetical protein [bacterium]